MSGGRAWRKRGVLFSPDAEEPWLVSHASLPVAVARPGDLHRVYFASRDAQNRSHVGYVDVDLDAAGAQPTTPHGPVLTPGPLGTFDDHGVYASSIVESDGRHLMYYIGWNPGKIEPLFYSSIGLAVSDDGGSTFRKSSAAPIMGRSEVDPCLVTSPCVMRDGDAWRMWYVSGFKWDRAHGGEPRSYYHIKYAESDDGERWTPTGIVCIDHVHPGERNIARPCVVKEGSRYRMWYSYGGDAPYRIGYAESDNGYVWVRHDEDAGIEPSGSGWDGRSQAYPWVVRTRSGLCMLYNGDDLGRTGFGTAVVEAD